MEKLDFTGRNIIVTGGGRGIGRAYVELLVSRGANVAIVDPGATADGTGVNGDPAADVVAATEAMPGKAIAIRESVGTEDAAERIVDETVKAFGSVNAIINNAGVLRVGPFDEITPQEYQRQFDVHFFGSLWLAKAAWSQLKASGNGRILNTISSAMLGNPQMVHYGSSKGAVFGMTRNLAVDGLADGILVNAIAPGAGGTQLMEVSIGTLSAEIVEYMRTVMTPQLVAPVGAFLVHPSSTVTGEVFTVAGGHVSRTAIVNSAGFHNPELSIEDVASNLGQIMTLPDGVEAQAVTQPGAEAPVNN